MAILREKYDAKIILTLVRSGTKTFREEEVAKAMLNVEQVLNGLIIPEVEGEGFQTFIRVHVYQEQEGGVDADNQDSYLA